MDTPIVRFKPDYESQAKAWALASLFGGGLGAAAGAVISPKGKRLSNALKGALTGTLVPAGAGLGTAIGTRLYADRLNKLPLLTRGGIATGVAAAPIPYEAMVGLGVGALTSSGLAKSLTADNEDKKRNLSFGTKLAAAIIKQSNEMQKRNVGL